MLRKFVIASLAIGLVALATAVIPTVASARHGGHGSHGRGVVHHGGGFHGFSGGGFRGFGFSGVYGIPYDFYNEPPTCGLVPVKYYYKGRAYWRSVLRCW